MTPVTVTIITRNEESNIRRCLESVAWADEIVVIDSHSTDATRDIARTFTDRVIERDWNGFLDQQSAATAAAKHDWVFAIDADEVVTDELRHSIETVLREGPALPGYRVSRLTWHLGRWVRHGGWYPDRKVRFFDRRRSHWGGVDPHAKVSVEGEVGTLAGDLEHYSYADLSDHIAKLNSYTTTAAAELETRGVRVNLMHLLVRPVWRFVWSYFFQRGFLDGRAGLVLAVVGAFYVFLRYAKLWETQRR